MNHNEHPVAPRVMELTERGMTSAMIAKLERLNIRTVRLIKLAHQNPAKYSEWRMMEEKRHKEEKKELAGSTKWGMTPEESESCRLAKFWK